MPPKFSPTKSRPSPGEEHPSLPTSRFQKINQVNEPMPPKFSLTKSRPSLGEGHPSLPTSRFQKIKAILTKDKCLTAIGERPGEVTDDIKWDEMDGNDIANLHLALVDEVLSSIEEKKTPKDIWGHLA
ncbi:hypothetical protein Tco_0015958 [Tanacetum coccineum]